MSDSPPVWPWVAGVLGTLALLVLGLGAAIASNRLHLVLRLRLRLGAR